MHFWCFWAKYCHFLPISSYARPKTNANKVPRWVFRYVGNKTFDFSSKKKDFLPKNNTIWPEIGIFVHFRPGLAAHLVPCCLVVVACGLYLARHLFTLYFTDVIVVVVDIHSERFIKSTCLQQDFFDMAAEFIDDISHNQLFCRQFTHFWRTFYSPLVMQWCPQPPFTLQLILVTHAALGVNVKIFN